MQGTWAGSLVQEDLTRLEQPGLCATAIEPVLQSLHAMTAEAFAPRVAREAIAMSSLILLESGP